MDTYATSYSDYFFFDHAFSIFRGFATNGFLRGLVRVALAVAFMVSIGVAVLETKDRASSSKEGGGRPEA